MTKFHEIEGEIQWANGLYVADSFEDGPSYYNCVLKVDLPTRDYFKDSGVRTKIQNSDDMFLVRLKRPEEPKIGKDGKPFGGGRPKVVGPDNAPWPEDVNIGNGSRVKARYVTYTVGKFKGHRLEEVKVLEHVPYNREEQEAAEEPSAPAKTPKTPW